MDIQFLPDTIVEKFNQQQLTAEISPIYDSLITNNTEINHYIPNQLLSDQSIVEADHFLNQIDFLSDSFSNFFLTYLDRLF